MGSGDERTRWFEDARFGLFLHWGLYSVLAGEWRGRRMEYIGEWIQAKCRIPNAEYERLAARFDPAEFDADAWVGLARRAGMRYIVYTAKHHEGFAMCRSRCDGYNIVDATPFGRDPLAELAEACARHEVALGLYYSQSLDWHERDAGGTEPTNESNFGMSWGNDWDFPDHAAKDFARYLEAKVKPQLRELLTGYGPISYIWFDCPFTITADQSRELSDLVRLLQPGCIVNSRIGHGMGEVRSLGDNQVPWAPVEGVWEAPATLNDTWGYKWFDENWKSPDVVLATLVGLAARGANYLLNIGPTPEGTLPEGSIRVLEALANWMEHNAEALHGTRPSPFPYDLAWGPVTSRPGRLYLHLTDPPADGRLVVRGLRNRVSSARILADPDAPVSCERLDDGALEVSMPPLGDAMVPVLALEIYGEASADPRLLQQGDGRFVLPAARAEIVGGREGGSPPSLDPTGILRHWYDAEYEARWTVHVSEPGAFRVEIITSAVDHSAAWQGGHRVEIAIGDQVVAAVLAADRRIESAGTRCYAQACSLCGVVRIESGGEHQLTLRPREIVARGPGLALVAVVLTPA